ncbi:hypothetical protein [Phenylobacterium sp.]|uniref:hypothetical protein n=1 Tax=Phenylobacterium sp. TaxID=1871053 RepID=UPI0039830112
MRPANLVAIAALAAVGLSACEGNQNRRTAGGGGGLCKPFTETANNNAAMPAAPGAAAGDASAAMDDCLHRWSYTLAASSDTADVVADAVVAACNAPLARWNQQSMGGAGGAEGMTEAPSLLTGQPTNPILEHNTFAGGRALFYVVQARAGKCGPPKAGPATTASANANTGGLLNTPAP